MPRLILQLNRRARPSSVRTAALDVPEVTDAREATTANVVIVDVTETTPAVRERLGALPNVVGVFDDLQAVPQVADPDEVEDFLNRVREVRGEEPPSLVETRPLRPDGGTVTLPTPAATPPTPSVAGPIQSIDDAMRFTGARALHEQGVTGEKIVSVVVDTGLCPTSFNEARRLDGVDLSGEDDPWTQLSGHGTMTAGIMAGDETTPGIDRGYLPDSLVFPIKTTLAASELIQAQDAIVNLANERDEFIASNNSWGFTDCVGICEHPVTTAIRNASNHPNLSQVFAGGNQAAGITGCGQACDGSTPGISGPNSLSNVITVAASGLDGQPDALQPYSSRGGPGAVACGSRKPDVAAPVFGEMPFGCGSRDLGNGGGTSAAAPQVAGAVGLIAAASGVTSTAGAASGLTATADQFIGEGFNGCAGAGNIRVTEATGAAGGPLTAGLGDTGRVATLGIAAGLLGAVLRSRLERR